MNDPSSAKGLISTMSKKWKLEQIPTKKLELENKLMEERLNQLKNELLNDKQKRSAQGGTIWSKGQVGPVTNYGKLMKGNDNENVLIKLSNRQMKLKILVDEAVTTKNDTKPNATKDKRSKCGQCEKKIAFTRCLECCEDYCANCFTEFHMKGALQKHRATPINTINSEASSQKLAEESQNEFQREVYKQQQSYLSENSYSSNYNIYEDKTEPSSRMMSAETRKIKNYIEPVDPDLGSNSLLAGEYDEKEAQEAFKKAVMEWRISKPSQTKTFNNNNKENNNQTKKAHAAKNASIGTDNSGFETNRSNKAIKMLETQISSTHSLSYAERCLLQKYRKKDISFTDGIESNELRGKLSKSFDSNNMVSASKNIGLESLNKSVASDAFFKSKNEISDNFINESNPVLIEEISQLNDLNSKFNINKLQDLEPDMIENKSESIIEIPSSKSSSYTRPDSLNIKDKRPKTPQSTRPPSSRLQSARPNSSLNKSVNSSIVLESNICRLPSDHLKRITERKLSIEDALQANIGDFLMLDVEKDKSNDSKNTPRTEIHQNIKVSHMLYEMSPRSWRPSSSLATSKTEIKVADRTDVTNSASQIINTLQPNQNANMIKSKKINLDKPTNSRSFSGNIRSKPQSLDIKTKNNEKDKKDFHRNKSFALTTETKKSAQKRAVSVTGSFAINIANLELGNQFIVYDFDDGRSSRICQNEEDDTYFDQLESELRAKTPKKETKTKKLEFHDMNVSNEKIFKNLSSELEFSLRNEELDDDTEMENLTLQELKSLR